MRGRVLAQLIVLPCKQQQPYWPFNYRDFRNGPQETVKQTKGFSLNILGRWLKIFVLPPWLNIELFPSRNLKVSTVRRVFILGSPSSNIETRPNPENLQKQGKRSSICERWAKYIIEYRQLALYYNIITMVQVPSTWLSPHTYQRA